MAPAFSGYSLLTDNSTLTLSFALEPTVKTHNNDHGKGTKRRNVTRVDSTDSESKISSQVQQWSSLRGEGGSVV